MTTHAHAEHTYANVPNATPNVDDVANVANTPNALNHATNANPTPYAPYALNADATTPTDIMMKWSTICW
tara:strand:+ start:711 stop:920 length:210 start_codon:yes stop_codon:yes gene_type:complete